MQAMGTRLITEAIADGLLCGRAMPLWRRGKSVDEAVVSTSRLVVEVPDRLETSELLRTRAAITPARAVGSRCPMTSRPRT